MNLIFEFGAPDHLAKHLELRSYRLEAGFECSDGFRQSVALLFKVIISPSYTYIDLLYQLNSR